MDISITMMLLYGLIFGVFLQTAMYIIARLSRDAGHVDVGWTAGVGILAVLFSVAADGWIVRRIIIAFLGAIWSFRLVYYIIVDRIIPQKEDSRYQNLRHYWGNKANLYFFFFFVSQAILIVIFAIPHLIAASNTINYLQWYDGVGLIIWITAIVGETISDKQLVQFRKNPANKGKTCKRGFWRYSRHPNYFFEWIHWWAYLFFALGFSFWWVTLIGPIVMLIFLFKITGIPYTEKQAILSRGNDYLHYQRTTNKFFPWFPKKDKS